MDVEVLKCDFDLAVAFFLQETKHLKLGPIPRSVRAILADFELLAPCTGRQDNILECAIEIDKAVQAYEANPASEKPFALRFPTLNHLHKLAIERSVKSKVVGKDKACILVDLQQRFLAIGVPPKVHPTKGAPVATPAQPDLTGLSGDPPPEPDDPGAQEEEERLSGEVSPTVLQSYSQGDPNLCSCLVGSRSDGFAGGCRIEPCGCFSWSDDLGNI